MAAKERCTELNNLVNRKRFVKDPYQNTDNYLINISLDLYKIT
jgi:hypothetical protein